SLRYPLASLRISFQRPCRAIAASSGSASPRAPILQSCQHDAVNPFELVTSPPDSTARRTETCCGQSPIFGAFETFARRVIPASRVERASSTCRGSSAARKGTHPFSTRKSPIAFPATRCPSALGCQESYQEVLLWILSSLGSCPR